MDHVPVRGDTVGFAGVLAHRRDKDAVRHRFAPDFDGCEQVANCYFSTLNYLVAKN